MYVLLYPADGDGGRVPSAVAVRVRADGLSGVDIRGCRDDEKEAVEYGIAGLSLLQRRCRTALKVHTFMP